MFHDYQSEWLTDGVIMADYSNSYITCNTNHFTSFTVLMSLQDIEVRNGHHSGRDI